jgi:uncharacterized RDD family membrane protein YckC
MPWFYMNGSQQVGPVADPEFERLAREGVIQPATLVWRGGMRSWEPYANVTNAPTAVCTVCGQSFPADAVVRIADVSVCSHCKPLYVQRLQEGATIPAAASPLRYAGFWIRFCATALDTILLFAISVGIGVATGSTLREELGIGAREDGVWWTTRDSVLFAVDFIVGGAYEVFLVTLYGGTLGKLACRLRVVTAGGERLTYLQSFWRMLAKWVSTLPCCMGFIFVAFDAQKRGLHDMMCNTRVIWAE